MSLKFKILIDDKIIGEVTKDIAKIDRGTDFSEPFPLLLHVSPATEKVPITCFLKKYCCDILRLELI